MRKIILAITTITIGAFAGLSFTGCHHRGLCLGDDESNPAARERRINHVKAHIADVLELTDNQVSELDRLVGELETRHAQLKSRRPELKAQFIETFSQDRLQADDITRIIDSQRPELEELLGLIAEKIAEFHAMLTPEQRAKLIAELESHQGRCTFGR